jgi:hypothetical protein
MARRCVCSRNLENEDAKARYRAVKIQPQLVVTPGKQTNKQTPNILRFLVIFRSPSTLKVEIVPYRGADKSLAGPGRKQATATEDFDFHISYL